MVDVRYPIKSPVEIWEIQNETSSVVDITDLTQLGLPKLQPKGDRQGRDKVDALQYVTVSQVSNSSVYRNLLVNKTVSSTGYFHTHDDKSYDDHTHDGLGVLTAGSSSDASTLHTHSDLIKTSDLEVSVDNIISNSIDLTDYVRKDGSITQLSDISSDGVTIEQAVSKSHDEVHTISSHDTEATGAELTQLTDGSNADCLHIHSAISADTEHNDLDGLNEGDYIHLTAAEYASLGIATGNHNDLDGLQGGNGSDEYYHLEYSEFNILTNDLNADSLHFHNATAIVYDNVTYPTVDDALDSLLYVTPNITSFTNNVGSVEIGSTVTSTTLTWTIDESADLTDQTLNQSIGSVGTVVRQYIHSDSYTTDRTYTLTITDGVNPDNASTSIYFRHKRYWGTNANTSLNDAQIIALSSELSTSRSMSKSITSAAAYIYFAWPSSWDSSPPATFTVNGLNNTAWTYVTRNFINASGYTEEYRIYKSDNLLTGSYDIVVS